MVVADCPQMALGRARSAWSAATLSAMTTSSEPQLDTVLAVYERHPLDPGDGLLLLPGRSLCLELEGLAQAWCPQVRRELARAVAAGAEPAQLALARPGGRATATDEVIWAELREELLGSGVELLPLRMLPAA